MTNPEISNETGTELPLDEVRELVGHVYTAMHVHPGAELEVRFVEEAAMSALHLDWMDLPGPTDVLSFPIDELRPGTPEQRSEGMLGVIVVCPAVAEAQAAEAGHSTIDEVLLLITHGLLHLLGYDHGSEAERAEMFGLQRHLLLTFFADRYDGRTDIPEPTEQ